MMMYMKLFLPADTTVLKVRPNPTVPAEAGNYREWLKELRKLSVIAQENLLAWCRTHQSAPQLNTPAAMNDFTLRRGGVWAVQKYLMKVPKDSFPKGFHEDKLTQAGKGIHNNVDISTFHK